MEHLSVLFFRTFSSEKRLFQSRPLPAKNWRKKSFLLSLKFLFYFLINVLRVEAIDGACYRHLLLFGVCCDALKLQDRFRGWWGCFTYSTRWILENPTKAMNNGRHPSSHPPQQPRMKIKTFSIRSAGKKVISTWYAKLGEKEGKSGCFSIYLPW